MRYIEARPRERKALVVERELQLMHDNGEDIRPETVLAKARSKKHPLHEYFEWDDNAAAERYRLDQARKLIQATKFVVMLNEDKKGASIVNSQKVRAILNVVRGEPFKMRNEVLDDEEMCEQFVDQKLSELRAWCRSVVDVPDLDKIRTTIERLLTG